MLGIFERSIAEQLAEGDAECVGHLDDIVRAPASPSFRSSRARSCCDAPKYGWASLPATPGTDREAHILAPESEQRRSHPCYFCLPWSSFAKSRLDRAAGAPANDELEIASKCLESVKM